ncbi:helix-turn-helix domain-containing protein [Peptoniphilus sp.]|jgi:hypothetical protein|uniref:helix-turn-helix domain-containing protein n=1 Tax=Peptoniphilus sp. TaxID=1971214 RepID=UPI003D8C60F1
MENKFLLTAKELAGEIPIGEHKIRNLANEYSDFPKLRVGNRMYFFKDEVIAWLKENSRQGIRL